MGWKQESPADLQGSGHPLKRPAGAQIQVAPDLDGAQLAEGVPTLHLDRSSHAESREEDDLGAVPDPQVATDEEGFRTQAETFQLTQEEVARQAPETPGKTDQLGAAYEPDAAPEETSPGGDQGDLSERSTGVQMKEMAVLVTGHGDHFRAALEDQHGGACPESMEVRAVDGDQREQVLLPSFPRVRS